MVLSFDFGRHWRQIPSRISCIIARRRETGTFLSKLFNLNALSLWASAERWVGAGCPACGRNARLSRPKKSKMNVGGGDGAAIPQCLSPNLNLFEIVILGRRRRRNNLHRSTKVKSACRRSRSRRPRECTDAWRKCIYTLAKHFIIAYFVVRNFSLSRLAFALRVSAPHIFSLATRNTIVLRCGHCIDTKSVFFSSFLFRCVPRPRAHLFPHKRFFLWCFSLSDGRWSPHIYFLWLHFKFCTAFSVCQCDFLFLFFCNDENDTWHLMRLRI